MNRHSISMPQLGMLYLIAWCISPPLAYGSIYRIIAIAVIGLFVLMKFNALNRVAKGYPLLFCVLFIVLSMVIGYATGDGILNRLSVYIFLSMLVCSKYIYDSDDDDYFIIIPFTFILCIVWNITSLRGISQIPNVMRLLAKNSSESSMYARRGIGGYGYIYTILLLLPAGIDTVLNRNNRLWLRIIGCGFVATSLITIFQSAYFLAIILSIVTIVFYFAMNIKSGQGKATIIGIGIILAIGLMAYADEILLKLIEITSIRSIRLKLVSMYQLLENTTSIEGSEFSTRYLRYSNALIYAIKHPFLGGLSYKVTGNHSHLIDFAAQYGFIVLGFYLYTIFQPYKLILYYKERAGKTVLVIAILILSLNVLAFSMGASLFIFTPVYFKYIQRRDNTYE